MGYGLRGVCALCTVESTGANISRAAPYCSVVVMSCSSGYAEVAWDETLGEQFAALRRQPPEPKGSEV